MSIEPPNRLAFSVTHEPTDFDEGRARACPTFPLAEAFRATSHRGNNSLGEEGVVNRSPEVVYKFNIILSR